MIDRKHSIRQTPGRRKVVVAYLQTDANDPSVTIEKQMQAIHEACERKMRGAYVILWIQDECLSSNLPARKPGLKPGEFRLGLTTVCALISRGVTKSLVVYQCSRLAATPDFAKELLERYLAAHNVHFFSVVDRVNNRQDLARLIDQARDGFTEDLLARWRRNPPEELRPRKSQLSPRQTLLLQLKAQGMSTQQVADRMGISPYSVHGPLSRICNRLGVASVQDAVATLEGSQCMTFDVAKPDTWAPSVARPLARLNASGSKPIAPLTPEHIRLLELLSTGLTIYEVAMHLEIEPERAEVLRRQAYLRLGVTNLHDAVEISGITIPEERPIRPNRVKRPNTLNKQELYDIVRELFDGILGLHPRAWTDEDCFPDELWILGNPATGACYQIRPLGHEWSLVCFSSDYIAEAFVEALRSAKSEYAEDCIPTQVSFDEAREIAKGKDMEALMLLDNPDNPQFHYVR